MKLLLFGATGGTGREILSQGLAAGHHITAFVRNPTAITIKDDKLLVTKKGDLADQRAIEDALRGKDAVISALGNKTGMALRQPNTIISDGLRNILRGMNATNVSRLIFITSFGVSDTIVLPEKLFIKIFLKNIFADIPLQESLIKQSSLEWTIVRPARFVNGQKTGSYKSGENLPIGLFSKISRADVADFILKNLADPKTLQKIMTVSY